jgi:hypothetical protein
MHLASGPIAPVRKLRRRVGERAHREKPLSQIGDQCCEKGLQVFAIEGRLKGVNATENGQICRKDIAFPPIFSLASVALEL